MSVFTLKLVCLANTASHPTARPSCLWDTALSRARYNALLFILVEFKSLSQGDRFVRPVIGHLTRFVILIAIENKALARLFVISSNARSRCLALQKHFIPTKERNLKTN